MKPENLRERLLRSTMFAGVAISMTAIAAPISFAQDDDEGEIEEFFITGSRIARTDATSENPVTVISGEAIQLSGISNLGEALRQQLASGSGGFGQSSNLSGGGATSVDLRNLGQDRVLVLINGKRLARFADGLANEAGDLSMIPTAMVERVEILRDGASSTYGADAVSGVINVILKDDFEGLNINALQGISTHGDGEQTQISATMGGSHDRGNIVVGAEFRFFDNIPQYEREWARLDITRVNAAGWRNGSIFSPGGSFLGNYAGDDLLTSISHGFGVACADFASKHGQFSGDGTGLLPFFSCPSFAGTQAPPIDMNGAVRYDYSFEQDIVNQLEVLSVAGYGTYEITDSIEAFMEFQYAKRKSVSKLDGNPGSFGTPTYGSGWVVPCTNTNLAVDWALLYGSLPGPGTACDLRGDGTFDIGFTPGVNEATDTLSGGYIIRPVQNVGIRHSDIVADLIRVVVGVRGTLLDWDYELSYLHTRVDNNIVRGGIWNLGRANTITDPAACAADIICSSIVNPSGSLDILQPGNWTFAENQYLASTSTSVSHFATTGVFASISKPDLLELPAGPLGVAFGFEYREDEGYNKPDSVTESGESVANQIFTTAGKFDVTEFFGEANIPVFSDLSFAGSLDVNVQGRWFDYSTFGSDTVWKVGANWTVTEDIRFRFNLGNAFRAPQITDLFAGGVVSFDFVSDPCANHQNLVAGGPEGFTAPQVANVVANCIADGTPAGTAQTAVQYPVLAGGNANVGPEKADTVSIGAVITPRWVPNLTVTVDWWEIELTDFITRQQFTGLLQNCYSSLAFGHADCAFRNVPGGWTRRTTGAGTIIIGGRSQTENRGDVRTDGIDWGFNYFWDWNDVSFTWDWQNTYILENDLFPGEGGYDERGSIPAYKSIMTTNADWNNWGFTWRTRYIAQTYDRNNNASLNNFRNYTGAEEHFEHDIRVGYEWDNYGLTFGVNNVFDDEPPFGFAGSPNTDSFTYNVIGRYFFLRASADF